MKYIPLSVPNFIGNEKKYVLEAIETEWVSTAGAFINEFEQKLADYVGAQSAVACQSGTSGIHLALLALGINDEHEVIVPTVTFIAAVNPVRYCGAWPVFVDCNSSLTMDLDKVESFLENDCEMTARGPRNKDTQKLVKAMIIVHVFGRFVDVKRLKEISKKYNIKLIEDATEALGSYHIDEGGDKIFAGTIGDFGIYSFNGNKIMTSGGGGMLVGKDDKSLEFARYLSTQAKDDALYYKHDNIGYNYRMTNIQAALGLAQLENLETFIEIKHKNYDIYRQNLKNTAGLELLELERDERSNGWFYSLDVKDDYPIGRDELIKRLESEKIQSRPLWGLIHKQIPYRAFAKTDMSVSNYYEEHILNLPCSTNLEREDIERICMLLRKIGDA